MKKFSVLKRILLMGAMSLSLIGCTGEKVTPEKPDRYSATEVGDYMLSNGKTIKSTEVTPSNQKDIIGIVAYLYKSEKNARLKDGIKQALKAKGVEKPHGLVLALKNAVEADGGTETFMWGDDKAVETDFPTSFKDMYDKGVDGYTITKHVKDKYSLDDFPAFKAALEYLPKPAFGENTGWYLPSESEWLDMLGDKGLALFPEGKYDEAKNKSDELIALLTNSSKAAVSRLNDKLQLAGKGNFDAFEIYVSYWSSSEADSDNAYYISFSMYDDFYFYKDVRNNYEYKVRPVFAF